MTASLQRLLQAFLADPAAPAGTRPGPGRPGAGAGPAGAPGSGELVMRGERWLLRVGRFLVARGARRLPAAARDERRREWEAELPVILGDPDIKLAAARAAHMLSFAADTLRGTVLRSGPRVARHRGAHRDPATWGKDFRELGVGVALLTGMAIVLAGFAYLVYQTAVGVTLPFCVCFLLISLAGFASRLVRRRPAGQCWSSAGLAVTATGQFADAFAARLSWGPPLLFTVISYVSYAVLAAYPDRITRTRNRQHGLDQGFLPAGTLSVWSTNPTAPGRHIRTAR